MISFGETLRTLYAQDFEPLRLRGRSRDTKRLYQTTLNNFERFLERPPVADDLTDETVSRYLSWFLDRGRSPYTVNKERSNLLALWRFLCRRRGADGQPIVADWPNVEPEIEPVDDPVAWLDHELATLFNALLAVPGMIGKLPACLWWFALHCILWDTGERIRATLRLRWADVDLANGFVTVRALTRKGRRRGMTYKLHPQSIEALKALRPPWASDDDAVFPWPYSLTYVWNRYKKILARAGLPTDRKSKFHRMRKSFASWSEVAGLNATELLGHSGRKVTLRYLDPRIVQQKHAADVLFRPT